jgi:protein O-GlcNAc transferase
MLVFLHVHKSANLLFSFFIIIISEIFACWMRIMKRVPGSVLWLLRFPGLGEPNIRAEAKAHGIDPVRIYFSDVLPRAEHLARIYLVDIMLDTPTFNGCSSVVDSLWGGTPVVTMCVDRMCARMGASVLKAAGASELVTNTLEQYEELTVSLAKDSKKLWHIREQLEEARDVCPLFNTEKWVRDFEQCLEMAWSRYEQGAEPDDIGVEAAEPYNLILTSGGTDLVGKGSTKSGGNEQKSSDGKVVKLLTVNNDK